MEDICLKPLRGWRAEVGMLCPMAGMYREWDLVAPDGVKFSHAVLGIEGDVDAKGLTKMAEAIEGEAKKLNMGMKKDLICLGCTSGSFIGGKGYDQKLIQRMEKASGSPATTTITSVLELFRDMAIEKIALVGPYIESVFDAEVEFLKSNGVETLYVKGLGIAGLSEYWDYYYDPFACYRLVRDAAKDAPKADCVFVTCMMSPIIAIVDTLEEEIQKPVISSCSATLYGILKKAGIPDQVQHYGQALKRPRL
jgi:maleate isomerase